MGISCLLSAEQEGYSYQVQFQCQDDQEIENFLKSASQLCALQDSPPPTAAALRRRAEEDVPNMLKALQSKAYYNAKVHFSINYTLDPALVLLCVETGPIYPFSSFKIIPENGSPPCAFDFKTIDSKDLGICIGRPALPSIIVDAEDILLDLLEKRGYPLAKLCKREVIADQSTHSISVIFHVDSGPLASFGKTDIIGDEDVLPEFFRRKIAWQEGERYNPERIVKTVNALEASGLFSSINITHDSEVQSDGSLPMHISIQEAKRRSIGLGVGYATDLGPGLNAEWEHRNIRGMGEKVSIVANLWQIKQEGFIRYLMPDFGHSGQDLIWLADVNREKTKGFTESSASFSGTIERQLTERLRVSYGAMFTLLHNSRSNNNREFNLFKLPLQLMWNKSNSLLDPTTGFTLHLRTTPSIQTLPPRFSYLTHQCTVTAYQPLDKKQRFVLAAKATWGSIWGSTKHSIPPSERFYAGSDTLLRGYRYLSVSPLGHDHKPIGGRSLMVYSLEARMRNNGPFGLVAFYDIGNVYSESFPQFGHKQLQSVGLGLRYHTPVGPLRIDLAFPLNRRHHLDSFFQLYFSIGQAF